MDPIPVPPVAKYRRALSTPSNNSPDTPHVSSAVSTVVFASVMALLLMLGVYCTLTRRRSISTARLRLVHQIRASMPSVLTRERANVALPIRNYTKEEMGGDVSATEDCPVCLVEFEEGEEVKVVAPGCEHVFHPACIDRWLVMSNTCPVCRSAVTSEETRWGEGDGGDVEVNGEGERGEGGEGEVAVNVENAVVSEEGEGEGEGEGEEGRGGEVEVNLMRNREGGGGGGESPNPL